jgi:hypothetical protein
MMNGSMIIKNKNIFMNMKREITIPESLNDITLRQYLEFSKVAEGITDEQTIENTLKTYKLIEIITNSTEEEIDELEVKDMEIISTKVKVLIDNFSGFPETSNRHIHIGGVDYAVKDMNELDNGEYISLNLLKEQYADNTYELFPKMLAILIRPATKEYDFERKEEVWNIDKFNRRDILNLELRSNLFLDNAKAGDVVPIINFFLSGTETSV